MAKLTMDERETIIRINRAEKVAHIFSSIPNHVHRLDVLCEKFPETFYCVQRDEEYGECRYEVTHWKYAFPKRGKKIKQENCADEPVEGLESNDSDEEAVDD